MANPTWPVSLPTPLVDGNSFDAQDNAIRSPMDAGVAKVRRRYTAVPEVVTFSLFLTQAQLQTLLDFHDITLKTVQPFDWRDFRKPDATLVTYRFRRRPRHSPVQIGLYWRADIELDLLTTFQGTFLVDVSGDDELLST